MAQNPRSVTIVVRWRTTANQPANQTRPGMIRAPARRGYNRRMPDAAIPLWPDAAGDPADVPTLTLHRAQAGSGGATVLICPGGGYAHLADHEGSAIASWLNAQGIHGAVLRYRLGPGHRHPAMIQDAQRAIRLLRANAAAWGIDPAGIAVMGFSAGGHLASTLAVHSSHFHCGADDLAGTVSARPDAAVLCYPVIEMVGPFTHAGSRNHLLGPEPSAEVLDLLTTWRHVTPDTPATFLWHCADDQAVPLENTLRFAEACRRVGVPLELHVYEAGGHGCGLAPGDLVVRTWQDHCIAFLRRHLGGAR